MEVTPQILLMAMALYDGNKVYRQNSDVFYEWEELYEPGRIIPGAHYLLYKETYYRLAELALRAIRVSTGSADNAGLEVIRKVEGEITHDDIANAYTAMIDHALGKPQFLSSVYFTCTVNRPTVLAADLGEDE